MESVESTIKNSFGKLEIDWSEGNLFALKGNLEIAQRRIDRLKREFEERGFAVLVNVNFSSGVDMIAIEKRTGRIVEAAEVTNYRETWEYIKNEKLQRYINSLNWFNQFPDVRKRLYVSYRENVNSEQLAALRKNNIGLIVCGGQD